MLSALLALDKRASSYKGELRLAHVSPNLMQLFKMTNLHKTLKLYSTTDKAMVKF